MYITIVLPFSDSCMYWCLAYVCEGIFILCMYVTVTYPYPKGVTISCHTWIVIDMILSRGMWDVWEVCERCMVEIRMGKFLKDNWQDLRWDENDKNEEMKKFLISFIFPLSCFISPHHLASCHWPPPPGNCRPPSLADHHPLSRSTGRSADLYCGWPVSWPSSDHKDLCMLVDRAVDRQINWALWSIGLAQKSHFWDL